MPPGVSVVASLPEPEGEGDRVPPFGEEKRPYRRRQARVRHSTLRALVACVGTGIYASLLAALHGSPSGSALTG